MNFNHTARPSWGRTICKILPHYRYRLLVVLTAVAIGLAYFDLGVSYEHPLLLLLLNTVFYLAVSVAVSTCFAVIFRKEGDLGFFLLACGVAMWGLSGLLGVVVAVIPDQAASIDANALITIHNCCVWVAAFFHLAAVILPSLVKFRVATGRRRWLLCGYTVVFLLALGIAKATGDSLLPHFFVQGAGGTIVRQFVITSAIAMFVLTALLLRQRLEQTAAAPVTWYESGLLLMALGLLCIWLQTTTGGWLGWYGRGMQYLGGLGMLMAATQAVRGGAWRLTTPHLSPAEPSTPLVITAVGFAGVLVTGALHLLVLAPTDPDFGFLTFLPAVMFAVLLGGNGAGWLGFVLAVLIVLFFHYGIEGSCPHSFSEEIFQFCLFAAMSLGVAMLVSALQRSRAELVAASMEKQHAMRHLENTEAMRIIAQRLENVIEGTGAGTWEWNIVTGETMFNERWAEMIGYRLQELAPTSIATWQRLAHPDDLARSELLLQQVFARKKEIYDCEHRMLHRDGRWIWIHDRGKIVQWSEEGKPLRMTGSHTDITARKTAEEGVRESERNFRSIVETISDLVVVASPEGKILFANSKFLKTLQIADGDLGEIHLLDLHPPPLREEAERIFTAMLRGEQELCPLPIMARNGTTLPVETRVWLGGWSGKPCIFGLIRDLTADQEQRQRFEALFRHNPTVMAITSHPEQTFVDINDAFQHLLGYERREVVGRTAAELGLFLAPDCHSNSLAQLLGAGRIRDHKHQVRCKDGTVLHGLFSGESVQTQGKMYHITVMVDLTERLKVEQELLQAKERAEHADAEKSRLLAVIAHEFRTPLALLNSSLDILDRYGERLGADDIRQQEKHIRSALAQLKALIDVSQSYNWLQSDTRQPQRGTIVLEDFFRQVAVEAKIAWADNHVFSFEIDSDIPTIDSDEVLLRSILINLLANAFQYTAPSGLVRLKVCNDRHRLVVLVEDDGIGIPPQDLPKVGHPFARGSNVGGKRGMGLGLSIVQISLQKLYGTIEITSEQGKGTTVRLVFPHAAEKVALGPTTTLV